MKNILIAGLVMVVGLGCATTSHQVSQAPLMTVDQVVTLSQGGASDQQIMQRIDKTGSVFQLTMADLTKLRAGKVSDPVVTHMLDTYTRQLLSQETEQEGAVDYDYGYAYPYTVMSDDIGRHW